jgi:hypothetical protein
LKLNYWQERVQDFFGGGGREEWASPKPEIFFFLIISFYLTDESWGREG